MISRSLLHCLLNTPWKYILLMHIFYLSGESPPSMKGNSSLLLQHILSYSFGSYLYLFFVIHFTTSKLIAKYKHKSIRINTQLTTFYCYSATNCITNLSNKQLLFTKFKNGYQPTVYSIPTLISSPFKKRLKPDLSLMSRE